MDLKTPPLRFRLRELLDERERVGEKISQSELARRSGLSLSIVNAIYLERQRQVSLDTLGKLCAALGAEPSDLFEYTPPPVKRKR